ncbi:MAG: hypothetical protein ACYTFW_26135 [Planctomycetota bacterium]|jgi:hypothetical protein
MRKKDDSTDKAEVAVHQRRMMTPDRLLNDRREIPLAADYEDTNNANWLCFDPAMW